MGFSSNPAFLHKTFLLSISYRYNSLKCIISQAGTPYILDGIKNTYTDCRDNKKSFFRLF